MPTAWFDRLVTRCEIQCVRLVSISHTTPQTEIWASDDWMSSSSTIHGPKDGGRGGEDERGSVGRCNEKIRAGNGMSSSAVQKRTSAYFGFLDDLGG